VRKTTDRYKQWTQGPRTQGDPGSLYTSQLVLGTSASSLAAFTHHDASHDVNQLEIISASEKLSAFVGHSHTEQ